MSLVLSSVVGRPLTDAELDANALYLQGLANDESNAANVSAGLAASSATSAGSAASVAAAGAASETISTITASLSASVASVQASQSAAAGSAASAAAAANGVVQLATPADGTISNPKFPSASVALPSNDFNQALQPGFYAGLGDGAGGSSSANAPVGSGNYRMDLFVMRGSNSITQFAVTAGSSLGKLWFRTAFVSSGNYAAALAAAPWRSLPNLEGPNVFKDTTAATKSLIDVEHYSDGSAGSVQTYGVDIHNYPGAKSGLVVHQYSNGTPGVWLDNTDNSPMIRINNTHNSVLNPGGPATAQGDFQEWQTEAISKLRLRYDYVFEAYQVMPTFFRSEGQALSIQTPSTVTADTSGIVRATTTNTGAALGIQNAGGTGVRVLQNGPGFGVSVASASGAAGFFAGRFSGYDYGLNVLSATDNGRTLEVQKDGTGSGEVVRIINKGTGGSIAVRDASSERFAIMANGLPKWSAAANVQTSVGGAGGASALPATPAKYLKVLGDDGVTYVIPAYLPA